MQQHRIHRTLVGGLLIAIAGIGGAAQPRPPVPTEGTASCRETSAEPAECRVSWSWDRAPHAYAWLQQYDPSAQAWRSLALVSAARGGVSQDTVEDGHLYRVLGCDDSKGGAQCSSTTVFWAPYRPATVDDIPEVVAGRYGDRHTVSKNLPYEVQVAQYNVYQLMLHLEDLDRSTLPAMTPPRAYDESDWSVWDTVAYNIRDVYEGYRTLDRDAKQRPAQQQTDWWRADGVR